MSNDNLALLAAAAYGNFTDIRNKDSINSALTNEKITEKQAEQFTNPSSRQRLAGGVHYERDARNSNGSFKER